MHTFLQFLGLEKICVTIASWSGRRDPITPKEMKDECYETMIGCSEGNAEKFGGKVPKLILRDYEEKLMFTEK